MGGEGGGWAWRCGRLQPRLPAPAAGLSGPGSSDVPRQECPSSDNVIYISGRVRGSAAPGARRPLCQEPRAALFPLRRLCRPRARGGRCYSPRAGESRQGPAARGCWVRVRTRETGAHGAPRRRWAQGARDARGPGDREGASRRCWAWGPGGPGGCGSKHPGARESVRSSGTLGELGACFGEPGPGASPGGAERTVGVRGVRVLVPDPSRTPAQGIWVLLLACGTSPCSLCLPLPVFSALSAQILFWGTCPRAPRAAQSQGGRAEQRKGPGPSGRWARRGENGQVQTQRGKMSAQAILQGPSTFPLPEFSFKLLQSLLPSLASPAPISSTIWP